MPDCKSGGEKRSGGSREVQILQDPLEKVMIRVGLIWCVVSILLVAGFNTCVEKESVGAGIMISLAALYVGLKVGNLQAKMK